MATTIHGVAEHRAIEVLLLSVVFGVASCSSDPEAAPSGMGTPTAGTVTTGVGGAAASGTVDSSATASAVTGTATTGVATTTGTATNSATSTTSTGSSVTTGDATTGGASTTTGVGGGSTTSGVTTTGSTTGAGGSTNNDQSLDGLPEVGCTVDILGSDIAQIQTVGVVTFSTDLPGFSVAQIQFGKDTSYGLIAPVNLGATDYRTLLLGMTQNTTYNYRIAVSDGNQVCYSDNQTIQTGTLGIDDLAQVNAGANAPKGFIVTSRGSDVIIFNEAGELVWGYSFGGGVFSAHMSWDGQYMFGRDTGPFDAASGGTFRRVAMDGSGATNLDAPGGDHHDFAPIPDGIAYIGKTAAGECDQVFVATNEITDGAPLFDTWQIYQYFGSGGGQGGQGELCHANRIHYFADGDLFTVSDRNKDAIAVFQRDGTPITSIGTAPSGGWTQHIQAEGAGSTWRVQHGHHFYAPDKLLVFSNNSAGGSAMLHYTLNGTSATLDWTYSAAGTSGTQGDVQHLPNGDFLVTASNSGMMHLLDASQNLISSFSTGGGQGGQQGGGMMGGFGYAWFRTTLYGPPPGRT